MAKSAARLTSTASVKAPRGVRPANAEQSPRLPSSSTGGTKGHRATDTGIDPKPRSVTAASERVV